ncbi:hypothetical protein FVE85_4112 [Porphyridium purpureum]|uniref:Uncharacterized protein n=1 Tax=Porphyridium purpureum TaxID=35688 RepID=A0A5J4YUQ1_PORPP|nr:hypothetical protein FVE85_4112 [Porphyridium purpureum]|eukprot:POR7747..scf229_5
MAFIGAGSAVWLVETRRAETQARGFRGVQRRARVLPVRMCERAPKDGAGGMDDSQLNKALREKIEQYFGEDASRRPQKQQDPQQPAGYFVSAAESDDTFQTRLEIVARKERRKRAAEGVITFVAGISLASGLAFTALFYAIRAPEDSYYQGQSGFVHSGTRKSTAFQPPRYGTESEIDPYALLRSESGDMQPYKPKDNQQK